MDPCAREDVDLVTPGSIELDADRTDRVVFIARVATEIGADPT